MGGIRTPTFLSSATNHPARILLRYLTKLNHTICAPASVGAFFCLLVQQKYEVTNMVKKALLVGINTYPGAPLSGCVNDVTDMATFLVEKCGYAVSNVRLLTDKRATTSGIKDRLNWLVTGLKPGDSALYHFSGHGTSVATRNPQDELDGMDEVECAYDFSWDDAHMLRDKYFHELFTTKIPAGAHFIWISDSCYSGDLTRGITHARYLPPPADLAWRNRGAAEIGHVAHKVAAADVFPGTLISGCKDNQTSADALINGKYNGALTYFLLKELKAKGGTTKALDVVIKNVRAALKKAGYTQIPQLEGLVQSFV